MTPFDELTLAEVEEMSAVCFGGLPLSEADPFNVAGGVMYMTRRREQPGLSWEEFKQTTRMYEINQFAALMNEDDLNPTNGVRN
jgi:hypothetical protein